MDYKPKTIKRVIITIVVLILIGYLGVDRVLVGENYGWTAFFILLGLTLIFNAMEEKDEEIKALRNPGTKEVNSNPKEVVDPRRYDPFYISDAYNPNRQKLMENENVDAKKEDKK